MTMKPWRDVLGSAIRKVAGAACGALLAAGVCAAAASDRIAPVPADIGGPFDAIGTAVDVFGDTAAVGGPRAETSAHSVTGAVQIFRRAGATWQREASLTASPAVDQAHFGTALALAQDLLVVQAQSDSNGSPPTLYTFARTGTAWQQVDAFVLPSGSLGVRLSGDRLIVEGGVVYVRAGSGWAQEMQLPVDGDEFASGGVAIDGDLAATGSFRYVDAQTVHRYVNFYSRATGAWVRETKVNLGEVSRFGATGTTLALSAGTALVGIDSQVQAFVRDGGAWTLQGMLDPLAVVPGFGASLALQGDRAFVGSPGDEILGHPGAGSVYGFVRSGGAWSRDAHFADPAVDEFFYEFSSSVALSGDVLVVGAPGGNTAAGGGGKADVFTRAGDTWTSAATLDFGNGLRDEEFGRAVAVDESTLLVGAWRARTIDPYVDGAAYVFEPAGAQWNEVARLMPDLSVPGVPSQLFGGAVALHAGIAAVGAASDDVSGAVYVFARGDGSWPQQAWIGDGGDTTRYLGWSLAFVGDVLVAGEPGQINAAGSASPGRVRAFAQSGEAWDEQTGVSAADGTAGDEFGFATAGANARLIVGAPRADAGIETDAGAAYIYAADGTGWDEEAKLTAPQPGEGRLFGVSVALSEDTAVVGAGAEDATLATRGGAYVYRRDGAGWTFEASLALPSGMPVAPSFGRNVAISGDGQAIVVAAPGGDGTDVNGIVYRFVRSGSAWEFSGVQRAQPPAPSPYPDGFGTGLAVRDSEAMIGAPVDGIGGAVYRAQIGDTLLRDGFDVPN